MFSDSEKVRRVLVLDDRSAYCDLVRKYQKEVRGYLEKLTRNHEIADDLAQETFLIGYRKLENLGDSDKYKSWLFSIARNQFLQWYRARKETSSEIPVETTSELSVSAGAEVQSLLKDLRPDERSALMLCLGHEFTHSEAAQALGLPLGTLKSLVLRAKEKLGASP